MKTVRVRFLVTQEITKSEPWPGGGWYESFRTVPIPKGTLITLEYSFGTKITEELMAVLIFPGFIRKKEISLAEIGLLIMTGEIVQEQLLLSSKATTGGFREPFGDTRDLLFNSPAFCGH